MKTLSMRVVEYDPWTVFSVAENFFERESLYRRMRLLSENGVGLYERVFCAYTTIRFIQNYLEPEEGK